VPFSVGETLQRLDFAGGRPLAHVAAPTTGANGHALLNTARQPVDFTGARRITSALASRVANLHTP
jgi:hypothetical protein